jgi:hypothetical protein
MGDGASGLAMLIGLVIVVVVVASTALPAWLGRRRFGLPGLLVFGALGMAASVLYVIATFYEDTWSPPLALTFEAPPGVKHKLVRVIEDPGAPPIVVTGRKLPFTQRHARLVVPADGIVRVRDLAPLRGEDVRAYLHGELHGGGGMGPGYLFAFSGRDVPPEEQPRFNRRWAHEAASR